MNTLNRKNISVALLITLGAVFSANTHATETNSIEKSLSDMVLAQGQQVMRDLTAQLQQSIEKEIASFSVNFSFDETITESLTWLTEGQSAPATAEVNQNNTNTNELNK